MIRYIRDIQAHRKGVELEPGFTLIELLIVIVVLGILAATVIFALGGVTSQSAQAACQSDGKSYEVAAAAFENAPANTTNAPPTKTTDLTAGAYVRSAPGRRTTRTTWSCSAVTLVHLPARAAGHVYVGKTAAAAVDYDTQTSAAGDGCFGVS